MQRVSKPRSRVRQQDKRPSSTQTSVEIPSNIGELSILELKNLCRELNFSCAGSRQIPTTRLQNEIERLSTNTPQSNIQTVPVDNTLYISNARESFSADQLAQITQIVSQSISSFFESQHATTTATRVDKQRTIPATANATRKARTAWSIPIFKFQRAPAAADFIPWTCCLNPASRWEIYARDSKQIRS